MKFMSFPVSEEMKEAIRRAAFELDVSKSEFIRIAIKEKLDGLNQSQDM